MIARFPGLTPTRSRAVIHEGLVFTVAVSPDPDARFYEQTRKALHRIDESLALAGPTKAASCRRSSTLPTSRARKR